MSSTGQLSTDEVMVVPGDEEVVQLTVTNTGAEPESYSLVATGFVQGWTIVDPPSVTLPPGGSETVRVALRPPRRWSVPAGASPLTIRIVSHDHPDEVAIAEGTVTVLAFDDRRLGLAQPVQRGLRRGEFDVILENLGNARASCRTLLVDASSQVSGRFDPPSLGVDPGDSTAVRLTVTAKRRRWRRGSRTLPFEVHALQEGRPPAIASGTLLQDPVFAGRLLTRLAVVLVTGGAVVAAWFGAIRPEIDRAARRAVDRVAAAATTVPPVASTVVPSGTKTGSASAGVVGQAFSTRLTVSAPTGQEAVESYTVPTGKALRITDVQYQNPNNDKGHLTLLRNSTVLYTIGLDSLTDWSVALVSPYVFAGGDTVTAQVTCQSFGDTQLGTCQPGITLSGVLVDA